MPRPNAPRVLTRRVSALATIATTTLALAVATAGPAAAGPARSAARGSITSGDARFEVLSPTLIRTEYAGAARFVDAPTFNAIGRDGFGRTAFTSSTVRGWLTIRTSALTLRYKKDSGPFTAKNLTVSLLDGQQHVTAAPWRQAATPSCTVGALCEAEDLKLDGVPTATDHTGYTGRGFAAGFQNTGNSMTLRTDVASAGDYDLDLRYANSQGGDGQNTTRTLSVSVDGGAPTTATLPTTANWDTWAIATVPLTLAAGTHTVTVSRGPADSGNVNIDSLALVTHGADYPAPSAPAALPCAYGSICEAEQGLLQGGAKLAQDHNDYSGNGFVGGLTAAGAADEIALTGVPHAGKYALQLRYASALKPQDRTMTVRVGTGAATTVELAPTSSWDSWRIVRIPVTLAAGDQQVTLGCPTDDSCNLNVDTVAFTGPKAALRAPHAPLGGYRRGLDGVNGGTVTTPGLLYQDGWSLLDDTASSIYDEATEQVTDRPAQSPYQDGYVFGYGQDYQQGLHDLATLTGPSTMLPRWAYGVWYSEYYDRTAAQYENDILPKFRADGVPLDVLVTDTDYKSPDTWDGWEIDTSKFPDPKAFFDWAQSQGLHNTLNIHPSIVGTDPQFPQAQATAKGKLIKDDSGSSCGGDKDCYVFDWSDPDQLKAYFDLHQTMEQQGADFWWLDWCCDASLSSMTGVTPDAWINQKYADDANKLIGRGFAFSRAYGSLQAGGYSGQVGLPTGPWADKRTTVHFTGDTTSSWDTLHMEVGYTPGESASTGLSAVSHDIGGFNNDGTQAPGAEPGSTKLPDDLYARWVQLGAFQPIDRLHSNHSDRLPWQYGTDAKNSAEKFLNLRENLVPYTYTLAHQANETGVPVTRPLYLQYPDQQEAYAQDGGEYLYGPDVLVAPVTTPGSTATTSVWFPPGSSWTDWFTGKTYSGGSTAQVSTDLSTMPVFVRSGGIVTTRSGDVTNDVQNPLTAATVTVAEGAPGSSSLYEDDGSTKDLSQSATTAMTYANHRLTIKPAQGSFDGQVQDRTWTVRFTDATAPTVVKINGTKVSGASWTWDADAHTLTVRAPQQPVDQPLTVAYR